MQLRAGQRLKSTACDTEVVVVRAPAGEIDVRCGGERMVAHDDDAPRGSVQAGFDQGTVLGKRYASEEDGIELLCTKAGKGSLALGTTTLARKDAKPLPSSD
ncbi:MAG: hypothetical protein E6G27_02800 [Actinobacteria bacterium]|nr:MAG: hypothetical protein E6G27_02800 [Actinomycetota bacterium]